MSFRRTCTYECETAVRTTDVYKMDADGCGKRRLTPPDSDNEHPEQGPAWSPDGERIAYSKSSESSSAIYTMKSNGSDSTLVGNAQTGLGVDWSHATARQDANVEQETGAQGVKVECTEEAGDEKQGIAAPPEPVKPEAYMDQIDELLQKHNLLGAKAGSEARRQARTATLKVLEESDPNARAEVVRFLAGAGLVQGVGAETPIISLIQADLEDTSLRDVHLGGANLGGADLDGVDMRGADLSGTYFWETQLRKSDLRGASLVGSNLTGAELKDADLRDADLTNANLFSADLTDADMTGAILTGADLREAVMSGTEITLPAEHTEKVAAWEAEAS